MQNEVTAFRSLFRRLTLAKTRYRYFNSKTVIANQKEIIEYTKSHTDIHLEPTSPKACGGAIERYYHFLFDLLLPLDLLIQQTPDDRIFYIPRAGAFSDRIEKLFQKRVTFTTKQGTKYGIKKHPLIGMNLKCVSTSVELIEAFVDDVFQRLDISHSESKNIILIERGTSDSSPPEQIQANPPGAARRSIQNHEMLRTFLEPRISPEYKFYNLRLEELGFAKQIELFSNAKMIVGQHGAGLANSIWMRPHSIVVEISHEKHRDHYRRSSQLRNHHYYFYPTRSSHASIPIDDFFCWLNSKEEIRKILQH